jgi:SAM-dependent methyltransferase
MSDDRTVDAYAANAAAYSRDWLDQPAPDDLYALLDQYFIKGGETADIGCGNGRDAAWLADHGYKVTGFDNSPELLAEARRLFPAIAFAQAVLPRLDEIAGQFDNVVCETVIMHLDRAEVPQAVRSLIRILRPDGVLYLSWRVTEGADQRHADGRLYAAFTPDLVSGELADCAILHAEDVQSLSSGKRICRIVARKAAGPSG